MLHLLRLVSHGSMEDHALLRLFDDYNSILIRGNVFKRLYFRLHSFLWLRESRESFMPRLNSHRLKDLPRVGCRALWLHRKAKGLDSGSPRCLETICFQPY